MTKLLRLRGGHAPHVVATVLGALVVVSGAWTISRSLARTPVQTLRVLPRTLSAQRSLTGSVIYLPTTALSTSQAGVVALVMAVPGIPVAAGDSVIELDREPLLKELVEIKRSIVRLNRSAAPVHLSDDPASLSKLQSMKAAVATLKQKEQETLSQIRSLMGSASEALEKMNRESREQNTSLVQLEEPVTPQDIQTSKELNEALLLVRSALEGMVLSQTLAISDVKTFFGAHDQAPANAQSSFLIALKNPQEAVPLWEKFLEVQRLKLLIDTKLKGSKDFENPQEALQLLLTSKSLTQMMIDSMSGLQTLVEAIEPTDQFPPAEVQAHERLLSRNAASMETLLDSLRVHEQRLLGLLERQAQTLSATSEQKIQHRSSLQELALRRSTILQTTSQEVHDLYQTLQGLRDARSRGMEQLITLEVSREGSSPSTAPSKPPTLLALHQHQEEIIQQLEATIIRASARGVVLTLAAEVGDALSAGGVVGSLSSTQPKIAIEVQEELTMVSVGQFSDILVTDADGGTQHFAGVVEDVDRSHPGQTSLSVRVRSPDQFLELNPSSVSVAFMNSLPGPVLAVPQSAIINSGKNFFVNVKNPSTEKIVERSVVVGFYGDDGWVEIQQGLTTGEEVVIHP